MKVEEITYEKLIDAICAVKAGDASPNLGWTCDPQTYCDVRLLHTGDGHLVTQEPQHKLEPRRLFGYPVQIDEKYDGLSFGRVSQMEDSDES